MKLVSHEPAADPDMEAAVWCLDLADGMTQQRHRAFERWLADPVNAEAFARASDSWETIELIGYAPEIVRMRCEALEDYRRGAARRWRRAPGRSLRMIWGSVGGIAAAVALAIGWSALPSHESVRTGVGERRVAILEDGSRLSLDADSEVETTFDARKRTLVLARGRARFDVAHNPLRPFSVAVGDKLVVATGTSFSVEKLGSTAHVVLFEGRVAVLDRDGAPVAADRNGSTADTALLPGHELTMPASGADVARVVVSSADTPDWERGELSFADTPLPIAIARMNRYLREPLVIDDAATAGVRVSGVFEATDASGFVDGLRKLSGVRVETRAGELHLTKD